MLEIEVENRAALTVDVAEVAERAEGVGGSLVDALGTLADMQEAVGDFELAERMRLAVQVARHGLTWPRLVVMAESMAQSRPESDEARRNAAEIVATFERLKALARRQAALEEDDIPF